jgi:hypothetical protein
MSYPTVTIDGKDYKNVYGFYFNGKTSDKIIDVIINAYTMKKRIRVFYGNSETGKSWNEEYDVTGKIGRSTGSIKIPLLIHNKKSFGGGAILDSAIVGITYKNQFIYKHDNFHTGIFEIKNSDLPEYEKEVYCDGVNIANFKREISALNYVEFLKGNRTVK